MILCDHPDTLHVRLVASARVRAERIAQYHGISIEAASAQIEASDRHRRNYLKRFYHVRWDDAELYDLVINTSRVTPDVAADMIGQVLSLRERVPANGHSRDQVSSLDLD
jgi:cytidylate kinase